MQMSTDSGDTLYHNAQIFTSSAAMPWAEALLVRRGQIAAVGTAGALRRLAASPLHTVDLHGRFVMPGLCDSHIHLYESILASQNVPLSDVESLAEFQARIRHVLTQKPVDPASGGSGWLRGQGWNESRWPEPFFPTAETLAPVTQSIPAIFWRSDMHVAVANQAALDRAGLTSVTPDPPGGRLGRAQDGALNGLLFDTAIDLVSRHIPPPTLAQLETGTLKIAQHLHSLGITVVHDQRLQSGHDGPLMLSTYARLHARDRLPLRIHCNISAAQLDHALALGLTSGFGDAWLRIGHVKFFIDGSLGSRTAWMLEPYSGEDSGETQNLGLCVTAPGDLRREFAKAMEGRLSISVHAIGDRANREVLDLFEELLPHYPPPRLPHRIEHAQILQQRDLPRLAQLGLTASVQPVHALDDIEIAGHYLDACSERARGAYAFRSLAESGARLAFGSDAPVASPNPLLGIHAAVLRSRPGSTHLAWQPDQAISLEAALLAYTLGPAQAVGCDHLYGTLEAGRCADFIVLGENPFTQLSVAGDEADLASVPLYMTILAGKPVYVHPDGEKTA